METIKDLIKKQYKDTIDKQILIKKFFKTIYRGIDLEEEQIRVFQNNREGTYNKINYFNDIDDLVNFSISKYNYYNNTYFELATTNGKGGAEENLKYRYCLAFDFDKKTLGSDFNHKDIINLFKVNKIYCHCIVDSAHGYHAYIMINRTNNIKMVDEVQKALATKLNADLNAIKTTQILRIPYSFNVKGDKPKQVKLVHLETYNSEKFKAYDIEFLYKKNCNDKFVKTDSKQTTYTLNNTNVPKCVKNMLVNGSNDGDRYKDLCNIVVALRGRNKILSEIKEVCKEWALKSNYDDNLEYRIENIYNNKISLELNCKDCIEFNNCYDKVISDFNFDSLIDSDGTIYNTYTLDNKIIKKIRNKQSRGVGMLSGNEVLILNVLKNEYENPRPLTGNGMDIKLLMSSITYKRKSCLSEKTLRETLKKLVDKKYIIEEDGARNKKYYKFNAKSENINNSIKISYFATIMCICGNITTSELSLYILMRYLHKEQIKQGITKGNIFQLNQKELSKFYYGDKSKINNQSNISEMINNLIECKILDIYCKNTSKNNGYEYNIYRLNS